MLCIILVNIIFTGVNYFKLHNIGKAIFFCLQMQFAIIIAAIILSGITRPLIHFLYPHIVRNILTQLPMRWMYLCFSPHLHSLFLYL